MFVLVLAWVAEYEFLEEYLKLLGVAQVSRQRSVL